VNIKFKQHAIKKDDIFSLENKITWCGSIVEDEHLKCHLFFSFWDKEQGFEAWCTHSQIGYAVADSVDGPFEFKKIIMPQNSITFWNRDVAHNPASLYIDGQFYLYYMGNYGNGEFWNHRNHQNIGVMSSSDADGKWKCGEALLQDEEAAMFSNPTICRSLDGDFMMIYKWVAKERKAPFYGPVKHGVAIAEHPEGPFRIVKKDIFQIPGTDFPGEDPFLFVFDGKYYSLLKDNGKYFSRRSRAIILFRSDNGLEWENMGDIQSRSLIFDSGIRKIIYRLERPQLLFCKNGEMRLLCAAKPHKNRDEAFLLNMKISSEVFEKKQIP
jgi:hypothetical protein